MPRLSALPSVTQLLALMRAHAVQQVVLCPGSRNSPLVESFSQLDDFSCRAATDERSAGFMALGWALETQRPVALVLTSGSAALNAHAAIAEAHYRKAPLLCITADRPAAWIGQQDGQTMPQAGIFGTFCPCSHELPQGDAPETHWHRNRLINEALLALRHHGGSPAHLNVALAEPLFNWAEQELPTQRLISRIEFALMGADEEEHIYNIMLFKINFRRATRSLQDHNVIVLGHIVISLGHRVP